MIFVFCFRGCAISEYAMPCRTDVFWSPQTHLVWVQTHGPILFLTLAGYFAKFTLRNFCEQKTKGNVQIQFSCCLDIWNSIDLIRLFVMFVDSKTMARPFQESQGYASKGKDSLLPAKKGSRPNEKISVCPTFLLPLRWRPWKRDKDGSNSLIESWSFLEVQPLLCPRSPLV